jgi:hypothetical protein
LTLRKLTKILREEIRAWRKIHYCGNMVLVFKPSFEKTCYSPQI